jgi:hypothetical protein
VVWKERRRNSPVAFRLKRGNRVDALTGVVVTLRPGRVRILAKMTLDAASPVSLQPGDVIYPLHYLGEGYDLFWFNGKAHSDQISVEVIEQEPTLKAQLSVEALSETEWWVKVKNAAGQVGWTVVGENFDGASMDACS